MDMRYAIRVCAMAWGMVALQCGAEGGDELRGGAPDDAGGVESAIRLLADARCDSVSPVREASSRVAIDVEMRDVRVVPAPATSFAPTASSSGAAPASTVPPSIEGESRPDASRPTGTSGTAPACACVPGTAIGCACPTGAQGAQVCRPDCAAFDGCQCGLSDGGARPDGTTHTDAGSAGDARPPSAVLPAFVTVQIVDALLAPAGPDGSTWDGLSSVDPQAIERISLGLGAVSAYGAIIGLTSGIALSQFEAPDPYGCMTRWTGTEWGDPIELPTVDDDLHPQWPGLGWQHLSLDPTTRIRLSLWDDDSPFSSDAMGTVELGFDDLVNALQANQVWRVRTSDSADKQPILFVGVSVSAEVLAADGGGEVPAADGG